MRPVASCAVSGRQDNPANVNNANTKVSPNDLRIVYLSPEKSPVLARLGIRCLYHFYDVVSMKINNAWRVGLTAL
jgi:hypothetical protein